MSVRALPGFRKSSRPKDKSTAVAKEIVTPTITGFTVESEAVGTKNVYKLVSNAGEVKRECATAAKGGCSAGGTW